MAADVTGDHVLDLVAGSSHSAWVLAGRGDGTFEAPSVRPAGVNDAPVDVAAGDLGAGPAVIVAGSGGITVVTDGGQSRYPACSWPREPHIADVTLDGLPDVVVACSGSQPGGPGGVAVVPGRGDGTFDAPLLFGSRQPGRVAAALAISVTDLNGDARPDVVVANEGTADLAYDLPGAVSVLLNSAVPPVAAPTAPVISGVTVGSHSATITWLRPADGGSPITGYTVTATPGGQSCSTTGADALSCTITGLTNGVSYTFTVTAHSTAGDSPPSGGGDGDGDGTSAVATPGTPPDPVTGVVATPDPGDGTHVTLHWLAAPSDPDLPVIGYRATAGPGGQSCTTNGELFCTITGLVPGQDYTFTVVAINGAGPSNPSDPVDYHPADVTVSVTAPTTPVALGDAFTATVTVHNTGPGPATQVTAALTPGGAPAALLTATTAAGACTIAGGSVTCTVAGLPAGAGATIAVVVEPDATGTVSLAVAAHGAEPDPAAANNAATRAVVVDNAHGCTLIGTPGADVVAGTNGPDVLCTLGGDDRVNGGNGDDVIYGGSGTDVLDGGNGNDTIYAGPGGSVLIGGNGDDTITGGAGDDTIYGGNGNDTITAGPGNDTVYGGNGNDTIDAGDGTDTVDGGNGNDTCTHTETGASCTT